MGWDTALINNFRWLFSARGKRSNFSGYGNIFNMPPIPKRLRILPVVSLQLESSLSLSGHSFQVILRLLNSQVQRKELMIPTSFVKIHRFLEVCGWGFFFFFCLFFCISSACSWTAHLVVEVKVLAKRRKNSVGTQTLDNCRPSPSPLSPLLSFFPFSSSLSFQTCFLFKYYTNIWLVLHQHLWT